MKKLITADTVKSLVGTDQKVLRVSADSIITHAARDEANRLGIVIQKESRSQQESDVVIDPSLVKKIVKETLESIERNSKGLVVKADPSGLRLVRGDSVVFEPFDTGKPGDKVGIKEILSIKESPNMATGFMTMEKSSFSWTLKYDEIDYIIDGVLEFTVNGKTYSGKAGDVFFIPSNTTVTFSTPDRVKFFFVTYPANWAELSNYSG